MDMARSMLAEFKSPFNFWAEAISTACHYSNRLYLRKGLNKTPYEIFKGKKPNVGYFKVFGCKCFFQKKGVRLTKFESKAIEGIFVGYGEESHTYRIYDKTSGIVVDSCSVVFDENDGSQVGQVDVCADDEIPQDAIGRVGVELLHPTEGHLVADREELCSTQVEPSSSQIPQASSEGATNAPTEEQLVDPPLCEQDQGHDQDQGQGQDQPSYDNGGTPSDDQDPAHEDEQTQEVEQAQINSQDGDSNDQDDQVIPSKEDIESRLRMFRERINEARGHTHDKVLGDLHGKRTTKVSWPALVNIMHISQWLSPRKYMKLLKMQIR